MADAVRTACSKSTFSSMSFINSTVFSVIFSLFPFHNSSIQTYVLISVYDNKSELSNKIQDKH